MKRHEQSEPNSFLYSKENNKSKLLKDLGGKSKDFETLILNESELKHMHAIRPYCSKERKSSRRESKLNQSPYELSRSKSKRFDSNSKKIQEVSMGGKQLNDMYAELINLKSQYKVLKANYNKLLVEKQETKLRQEQEIVKRNEEFQRLGRQIQKQRRNKLLMQQQLQRIKKQCCRIVQIQRFKVKKLQQTLQQKQLMIAFLRNQVEKLKNGDNTNDNIHPNSNLFFMQNSLPLLNFQYLSKQPNIAGISDIRGNSDTTAKHQKLQSHLQEDSLSFSRDRSKEMDSIIHSFLSNEPQTLHNFTKKDNIINSLEQSPIEQPFQVIEQISEKSEKQVYHNLSKKVQERQCRELIEKQQQTIAITNKLPTSKNKLNTKRLQIALIDENVDTNNIGEQISMETKKKALSGSIGCRQKKKLTAKKSKQI